tara:strand:+ start:145 stop:273 length:129 start_codon:yes stop_codon:yes gene_type:complete
MANNIFSYREIIEPNRKYLEKIPFYSRSNFSEGILGTIQESK